MVAKTEGQGNSAREAHYQQKKPIKIVGRN